MPSVIHRRPAATLVVAAIAAAAAGVAVRPYARAASLVVRAAGMQGWPATMARWEAVPIAVGPRVTVPSRYGPMPARVYRPAGEFHRTALLFPGVHAMGVDEPRLTSLAREAAATGVAVVTIALPDLMQYRITPRSTDMIEDAVRAIASRADLAPDGRVGVVGISFAGGLAIVAAGRASTRDRIAFVLSFGGHGDLPRVLRYLCTGVEPQLAGDAHAAGGHTVPRPPHDYGVAIILYDIADRLVPPEQVVPLRHGIETFLAASQLTLVDRRQAEETFEEARRMAARLDEPAATLLRLVNARDAKTLGPTLLPHAAELGGDPALSPERSPRPAAPVFLLHGIDDNVIPAVESRLLSSHLSSGGRAELLLSGVITHADVDRAAAAAEVWKLVGFWKDILAY